MVETPSRADDELPNSWFVITGCLGPTTRIYQLFWTKKSPKVTKIDKNMDRLKKPAIEWRAVVETSGLHWESLGAERN